jgi:GNAT superfamily N-acetyltransferase
LPATAVEPVARPRHEITSGDALRERLTRTADLVRTVGLRHGVGLLAAWLFRRREFVAVAFPLAAWPEAPPDGSPLRCDLLGEADLPALLAGCPEATASEARRRWAAGLECLVLRQRDTILAYRWDVPADLGPIYLPYLGAMVRPARGDVLTYEARTLPSHRRGGLGVALFASGAARARARGARRCVGLIAAWNKAGLRWAEHCGWERVGTVGYRRMWSRRRYFATGMLALVDDEVRFLPSLS